MIAGLMLFGVGAFLFWPAALSMRYGFFLFALFVMAGGLAFLETASNPFITQIGSPAGAERRLNLAQAFNPIGAISGVLLGTIFIFSGVELSPESIAATKANHTYEAYLKSETLRVVSPLYGAGNHRVRIGRSLLLQEVSRSYISNDSDRGERRKLL